MLLAAKNAIGITIGAFSVSLGIIGSASVAHADKIALGSHIGYATIVTLKNRDSNDASVSFRRELDDEIETCVRESRDPEELVSEVAAKCARKAKTLPKDRIRVRKAFCGRHTLYTEFGNFSLARWQVEKSPYDGGVQVRTDWKDHRTGQLIGNCGGCNEFQILDTFKILCPGKYRRLFGKTTVY